MIGNRPIPVLSIAMAAAMLLLVLISGCGDGALRTEYRWADRIDVPYGLTEKQRHELDLEELWLFNIKPTRMPSLVIEADLADAGGQDLSILSTHYPPQKLFDFFARTGGQPQLGSEGLRDPETNIVYNMFEYPSREGREGRVLIASLHDKTLVLLHVLYYKGPAERDDDREVPRKRRLGPSPTAPERKTPPGRPTLPRR